MKENSASLHRWQRAWVTQLLESNENRPTSPALSFYRVSLQNRLLDSLATIYPAVVHLGGGDVFARIATGYWRWHLPEDPDLMLYGEHFGAFLRSSEHHKKEYAKAAQLEWFLHRCTLECCHPLVPREYEAPILLGRLSDRAVYLERRPRLFRTDRATYETVAPYHGLPECLAQKRTIQGHQWVGIGMFFSGNEPRYLSLSPGEFSLLHLLCGGQSLEVALQWGLYADPLADYQNILESCRSTGLLKIG
ncbi:putative DNA-binding domain-containing protein [Acidithiobacillus sp.]|uniref:HvfC/BufC family peptide modification chaperone n=1 Tax=Acidithiobacillus sp. TaxID=1872118 RepID=UPI003D01E7CD